MTSPSKVTLGVFLAGCFFIYTGSAVTTVFIEECQGGKYFWKEKLPTEFYACLSVPRRAVKLRCPPGTYMCNTGPDYFQPCMCKGKTNKYYKQYGISEKLYKTEYLDNLLTSEEGSRNEINNPSQYIASTMSTLDDQPKGPEGKEGYNMDKDNEMSMPHNGCPDSFRMVESAHMYFGVPFKGSLMGCQQKCIGDAECLGVDYNKKKGKCFMLSLADKGTIRFGLNYNAYVRHYRRTYCVSTVANNVYYDTTTTTEPMTTTTATTAQPTTVMATTTNLDPNGVRAAVTTGVNNINNNNRDSTNNNLPQIIDLDGSSDMNSGTRDNNVVFRNTAPTPVQTQSQTTPLPATTPTARPNPGSAAGAGVGGASVSNPSDSNDNRVVSGEFSNNGIVIPDSGCPFSFEKIEGMSHPFGVNITFHSSYNDAEECKYWCLTHAFCKGVDFDTDTDTCYYLREIDSSLIIEKKTVTHYRITTCEPPIKCWTQDSTLKTVEDQSIMNATHPQTACNGVCYVSQTTGPTDTRVQRGCMAVSNPVLKPDNGCTWDEGVYTIICFCDTPRCNGLSINALASLMLYMPLDGDLTDHSGLGRHGQIPTGYNSPNFQCLDKSVNCAALFAGNECISVTTLATTAWGEDRSDLNEFVPTATFAVWFKKIPVGPPEIEGIFGNSIDSSSPSWQFLTEAISDRISAGVATSDNSNLRDYPYTKARDGEWHLAVMTYDGRHNASAMLFPTLTVYIDCVPVMGNSKADIGPIGIRNQPVSIGCVQDKNFVGFIDEARIFSTVLEMKDIYALKAMRDTNYFW